MMIIMERENNDEIIAVFNPSSFTLKGFKLLFSRGENFLLGLFFTLKFRISHLVLYLLKTHCTKRCERGKETFSSLTMHFRKMCWWSKCVFSADGKKSFFPLQAQERKSVTCLLMPSFSPFWGQVRSQALPSSLALSLIESHVWSLRHCLVSFSNKNH